MKENDSSICSCCGQYKLPRNPFPTVDVLLYRPEEGVLLIERSNPPYGWALPGGFIDYGESAEQAAVREMREETGLQVLLTGLLGVFSDPKRDSRFHTLSVVFLAQAEGLVQPKAGDDAKNACFFPLEALPVRIAFDHRRILEKFCEHNGYIP